MARLVLMGFASLLVGCHAPGMTFDPFGFGRQTRVPPPPTHAIGNASGELYRSPQPASNAGAASRPHSNSLADHSSDFVSTEAAADTGARFDAGPADVALTGQVELVENDSLRWRAPGHNVAASQPLSSDPLMMPRLLPRTGPVAAITRPSVATPIPSSPPRVRGFRNSPPQDGLIPAETVGSGPTQVRQAAGWQPRYDEVRR